LILFNFKIYKCLYNNNCLKDYHLCYYYHDIYNDKRRCYNLFRYLHRLCNNYKNYVNQEFCYFCHSLYEYNYHPENFSSTIFCSRKQDGNEKCIYNDTCYGIHYYDENYNSYYVRNTNRDHIDSIIKVDPKNFEEMSNSNIELDMIKFLEKNTDLETKYVNELKLIRK